MQVFSISDFMLTKLVSAEEKNFPAIVMLAKKIWQEHYIPIIGAAQVDYMLKEMYSLPALLQQKREGQQFFLIYMDENPEGYLSVSGKSGDFFLHKYYLNSNQQGKGIGKKIFSELINLFPEIKTIRLQVNRMNYKSVNFYFRLGFVIETAKDFDIGKGYLMEDYVMVLKRD
ncbi:GNAT family N-acetyltransferase [soil metagenome]